MQNPLHIPDEILAQASMLVYDPIQAVEDLFEKLPEHERKCFQALGVSLVPDLPSGEGEYAYIRVYMETGTSYLGVKYEIVYTPKLLDLSYQQALAVLIDQAARLALGYLPNLPKRYLPTPKWQQDIAAGELARSWGFAPVSEVLPVKEDWSI